MDDFSIGILLLLLSPAIFFAFMAIGRYIGALLSKEKVKIRYTAQNGEILEFTVDLHNDLELKKLVNRLSDRRKNSQNVD